MSYAPLTNEEKLELFLISGLPINTNSVDAFYSGVWLEKVPTKIVEIWEDAISDALPYVTDPDHDILVAWVNSIGSFLIARQLHLLGDPVYKRYSESSRTITRQILFGVESKISTPTARQFVLDRLDDLYRLYYEELRDAS